MEGTRTFCQPDKSYCFEKNFLIFSWFENMFLKSRKHFSIRFEGFAVASNCERCLVLSSVFVQSCPRQSNRSCDFPCDRSGSNLPFPLPPPPYPPGSMPQLDDGVRHGFKVSRFPDFWPYWGVRAHSGVPLGVEFGPVTTFFLHIH